MEKSLFAGLTILDEDESILEDAGAFVGRDREIIDRLLELGAKTHRHDGTEGLLDPVSGLGASAIASAGTLPGDLTFSIGYTLEDDDRGETLISPLVTMTTPPVIERPLFAPAAEVTYVTGDLLTDTYYYAISYTDAEGGETQVGPSVSVEREPGFANAQVELSGLTNGMVAAGATGWRLYRAVGGGDFHYLDNGVGDTYIDDGTVPVQPDQQPLAETVNTTNNDNGILLQLPSADARVSAASFINIYMSEDGSFSGNVFLQQFPVASAGATVFYPSVSLFGEQPPDVNNSIGGASLIDPDTDLLDWHWKRPVTYDYQLGSGVLGDVRMVTSTARMWGMLTASGSGAAAWTELIGDATIAATDADGPLLPSIEQLEFVASGEAVVGVTDLGGGTGRVTIYAPSAAAAVAGGSGHALRGGGASGFAGTALPSEPTIDFNGLGEAYDWPAGSATVVNMGPTRVFQGFNTSSLASGASDATIALGMQPSVRAIMFESDFACRFRLYMTSADRTADAARPIGTDPTGDHGLIMEVVTDVSLIARLSPQVDMSADPHGDQTRPYATTYYASVQNLTGATHVINCTLTYLPTERR